MEPLDTRQLMLDAKSTIKKMNKLQGLVTHYPVPLDGMQAFSRKIITLAERINELEDEIKQLQKRLK